MSAHVRSSWARRQSLGEVSGWLVALAAGLSVAALLLGTAPTLARSAAAPLRIDAPVSLQNLTLSVSPGSWRMTPGASAVFAAAPVDVPPGCSVGPLAMTWSLPGYAAVDGFLNRSAGASVSYRALSPGGDLDVHAEAQGSVDCGGSSTGVQIGGDAYVTILTPLLVSGFLAEPNPTSPGGRVLLQWTVDGGVPPYSATIDYGDGSHATFPVVQAGSPFVVHHFTSGVFDPVVTLVDSEGSTSTESLAEPVLSSARLQVGISPPFPTTDPDREVTLTASVSGGVAPYLEQWTSSDGDVGQGSTFDLMVGSPGTVNVTLWVLDSSGASATVTSQVVVVPPPAIRVLASNASSDVGRPLPGAFNLSGGIGPFTIDWQVAPGGPNGSATVAVDGAVVEPVVPDATGSVWVEATVTDALGASSSGSGIVGTARLPPAVALAPDGSVAEAGSPYSISATVLGGTLPIDWSLVSSIATTNGTTATGTVGPDGSLTWSGVFVTAGNSSVDLYVVDGSGASVVSGTTVRVLPALVAHVASLAPEPRAGAALPVGLAIMGGEPPYAYAVNLSDGEQLSGTLAEPGSVLRNASPAVPGYLTLSVRVTDGLGVSVLAQTTAVITSASAAGPPPSSPAPPASSGTIASEVGVGAVAAVLAVAFPVLRRWRSARGRSAPHEAAAAGWVRRQLRGTDGLDRATLDLLAVEEGIDPVGVERAVAMWERAGRIRPGQRSDGEVTLVWSDPEPSQRGAGPEEGT